MQSVRAMARTAVTVLVCVASTAAAQRADHLRAGVAARPQITRAAERDPTADTIATAGARAASGFSLRRIPAPYAPVVSALVPGAGQVMQSESRAIVYGAIEALSWWRYAKDTRDRAQRIGEFKDISRRVARAHFSPNGPDGDWTYYEGMRDFLESGDFSKSDATLIPETDPNTYNGHRWEIAQGTTDSQAAALAEYARTAVKPDMQWSWRNAQLQLDQYRQTTAKRNDANDAANRDLALLALNHLVSMVDAFARFRLQVSPAANGGAEIGASWRW
jgi:hypothetical protein